jgi:hypothetical protein
MLWNTGATLVTNIDETPPNFIERKHPRKGKKKETRGKDGSPGSKQTAQQQRATRRKGNQ